MVWLLLTLLALPVSGAHPSEDAHAPPEADTRERLANAKARYRQIADRGGWPALPSGPLVRPGETDPAQVPALRQRLAVTGDLGRASQTGDTMDPALADALKAVQDRHGLSADGVLGPNTRAAIESYRAARGLAPSGAVDATLIADLRAQELL